MNCARKPSVNCSSFLKKYQDPDELELKGSKLHQLVALEKSSEYMQEWSAMLENCNWATFSSQVVLRLF